MCDIFTSLLTSCQISFGFKCFFLSLQSEVKKKREENKHKKMRRENRIIFDRNRKETENNTKKHVLAFVEICKNFKFHGCFNVILMLTFPSQI